METKKIVESPAGKPTVKPTVKRVKEEDYGEFFKNLAAQKKQEENLKNKNLSDSQTNGREDGKVKKTTKVIPDTPRQDTVDPLCVPLAQFSPPNSQETNTPLQNHEEEPLLSNDKQPSNGRDNSEAQFRLPIFVPPPTVFSNEPKLAYIKNYFKAFSTGDINKEYEAYLKAYNKEFNLQRQNGKKERPRSESLNLSSDSLLALFEEDGKAYFQVAQASPFCWRVRQIIMEFERNYMEYAKPRLRDWLWENCHEELFFLKYACKKSVDLNNDMFLALVIHDIKDLSEEAIFPSCYHDFKNKLKELNKKRCDADVDYSPNFSAEAGGNLLAERERLIGENIQLRDIIKSIVQEENSKGRERERELLKSELIAELGTGIRCTIL